MLDLLKHQNPLCIMDQCVCAVVLFVDFVILYKIFFHFIIVRDNDMSVLLEFRELFYQSPHVLNQM